MLRTQVEMQSVSFRIQISRACAILESPTGRVAGAEGHAKLGGWVSGMLITPLDPW